MNKEEAVRLVKNSSAVKWYPSLRRGVPGSDWFLLEINPMPYKDEISMVIADIDKESSVYPAIDGKVYHWDECNNPNHKISSTLNRAIDLVDETTFKIIVYAGKDGLLNGQPIAISLDPIISYNEYPDHPHLNSGGFCCVTDNDFDITKPARNSNKFYIPDSFCYHNNPTSLGSTQHERLSNAFAQISIWLFRHQIWLATRKILGAGKGQWIGPEEGNLTATDYVDILNPYGDCRCGSGKRYLDCHMFKDVSSGYNYPKEKSINTINGHLRNRKWLNFRFNPSKDSIKKLKLAIEE